jgi:hypothetical protein
VSVTVLPTGAETELVQGTVQLIPAGDEESVPLPDPKARAVTVRVTSCATNFASTICARLMVTLHVGLVPEQAPDHPANVDVASGIAVSVITGSVVLVRVTCSLQLGPHAI